MNKSEKNVEVKTDKRETVWPPPPDPSALHPLEQEPEEGQEPLVTKFAWLDALVGLILGPVLLFALFIVVAIIGRYFCPPPRSAAYGYITCLIDAGLCATFFWLIGRRFRMVATTAALGASVLLLFLLFIVWFGSGMMTDTTN